MNDNKQICARCGCDTYKSSVHITLKSGYGWENDGVICFDCYRKFCKWGSIGKVRGFLARLTTARKRKRRIAAEIEYIEHFEEEG